MSANNIKHIDVYSDKFDKVRVIDFEKLKQESLRLYNISKKSIFRHIINWIIIIFYISILILLFVVSFSEKFAVLFFLFVLGGGAFTLKTLFLLEEKLFKNKFPEGTPKDLFNWHFKPTTIEKKLYLKYILDINDTLLDNFEYRILGIIKSNESYDNLKEQAYKLKANILINYQVQINYTSNVMSDYFYHRNYPDRFSYVSTDTQKYEKYEAIAVEILSDNKKIKIK